MTDSAPLPDFRVAQTIDELAEYFGILPGQFKEVIAESDPDKLYIRHRIPKRRPRFPGDFRLAWEPKDERLSFAHKSVARRLDLFARVVEPRYPNAFAYGYVRGRGTKENASRHCGAAWLVRADLHNFFPSIKFSRVRAMLLALGLSEVCADGLARFCTINGDLPLGLNASPLIANLVCLDLDDDLANLAHSHSAVFTRYADDLTFSSQDTVPSRDEIRLVVGRQGFTLSKHKFRTTRRGQAQFVTGLSVEAKESPHVPRRMSQRLRLELYYGRKFGLLQHIAWVGQEDIQRGINRLDGLVRYVSHIEDRKKAVLRGTWSSILQAANAQPSYAPQGETVPRDVVLVIDESEFERADGTRFLGIACAVTEHLEAIRFSLVDTAREYRADPFAPGRPERVDRKGLHYTDLPETIRDTATRRMALLPFRGYVAFGVLGPGVRYEELYLELLDAILPRRLRAADTALVTVEVEENPSVSLQKVKDMVAGIYGSLVESNDRRPLDAPPVEEARKIDHPELALPDFLLGVLAHYLAQDARKRDNERLRFERLRDKYRVVLDMEREIEFSRRRPLVPWDTPASGDTRSGA